MNSCSQIWLIEQLYIELGLTDFFSFEFVGYYLSSYDEAKIGSKLLTGSWRQKIDSSPGMNEPTNLLLQIHRGVTLGGGAPFGRIKGAAAIAAILLLAPPLLESHLRPRWRSKTGALRLEL